MTLAQLRSLVWSVVDDAQGIATGSGGYFTTAQVDVFLNNAQRETQKQLLQAGEMYYLKTVESSLVVGQRDYVLPTDFLKCHRLEIVMNGTGANEDRAELQYITLNTQNMVPRYQGTPMAYAIKKNRVSLYPIPDLVKTIRIYYSYRVEDLVNASDIPDVPEEFHEYLAILAAKDCFIKDDRNNANIAEKETKYLKRFEQMAEDRDESGPRYVIPTSQDGYGNLF